MKIQLLAELHRQPADHVPPLDGIHVLLQHGVHVGIIDPGGRAAARVLEGDVGEVLDDGAVQAAEIGELVCDDVGDFIEVLGSQGHARVAQVGDPADGFVEVPFGELRGEKQKRGADGGHEVDLVGEPDAGVIAEDLDGFVESAGQVEGVPLGEILAQRVEVDDAVFDQGAVHGDVGVEVDARAPFVLDVGDGGGAETAEGGIVVAMLGEVQGVPVLGVGDAEDEVNHFAAAALDL